MGLETVIIWRNNRIIDFESKKEIKREYGIFLSIKEGKLKL